MNLRHAAALALVGWYLMVPPSKCVDKSRNDLGVCDMHYDATADLFEWQEGQRFPTAEACSAFIAKMHRIPTDLGNERREAGMKCVPWNELRKARQVRRAKLRPPVPDSDEPHPRIIESDPSGNVIEVY